MSDYTSRATATFEVNGKQGEQELTKLRKKAEDLREALMNAWKTGDSTAQKGLQKDPKNPVRNRQCGAGAETT